MDNNICTITSPEELRACLSSAKAIGKRVGLVPTMGALHEGHVSLIKASVAECDHTVVTIFINPTQFGPSEDFAAYPRTLDEDVAIAAGAGADIVFAPKQHRVYRPGDSTYVLPPQVANSLEGEFRPGHFRGVCTIVLKLFNMTTPDIAYFGQKDFQQALVIRSMVDELDLPIKIRALATYRDPDGLATSSRNKNMNPEQRSQALAISQCLLAAETKILDGENNPQVIRDFMQQFLTDAGIDRIDYAEVADTESLDMPDEIVGPVVLLIAAHVGATRLIDNRVVTPDAK